MKRTAFRWVAVSSVVFAMVVPTLARTRPRYGGTLRLQTQASAERLARGLVLETLTSVDEAGNAQPLLASRWLSQNDGTRWQFWLRSGVTFHDATPLTPAVVAEALSAAKCDGACPWRTVRVLGDSVLFETDQPIRDLPSILALDEFAIVRNAQGTLVGSGPFRIQSGTYDTITLAAFEDAWAGRPFIDAIEIRGGRSVRDQLMDLGVGRADLVEVPAEQLRRVQQERVRVFASRPVELIAVRVERNSATLQNRKIREALAQTWQRTSLRDVIFQKQGEMTASVLPSWLSGYYFLFPYPNSSFGISDEIKPEVARLGSLGLAVDSSDSSLQLVAERLALDARAGGFKIQVVPDNGNHTPDLKVERTKLESTNPAVALWRLGAKRGAELSWSGEDRSETPLRLFQAEQDFLRQWMTIPLLYVPLGYAASARIHNLELRPLGEPALAEVWLEGGK